MRGSPPAAERGGVRCGGALASRTVSMRVMQLDDSTFCAGSCPHARKTAVTTLEACALNPPSEPAIAEPTRFLFVLTSATRA
eukprot:2387281-Prymnesium_polylepis.1